MTAFVTAVFNSVHFAAAAVFRAVTVFVTVVLMFCQTVDTVVLILFTVFDTAVLISVHFVDTVVLMLVTTFDTVVLIAFHAVDAIVLIFSDTVEKNVLILFHVFVKNVLILFHTCCQLVPNHPKNTFAMPLIVSKVLETAALIPFHTVTAIPLMAFHALSQSPLHIAITVSIIPKTTFNIVSTAIFTLFSAPVMIGASKLHSSVHTVFIAFVISSNVIPNSSILAFMPSANCWNACFTPFQISITAFLKSSLVVHRVTMTAVIAAIAAATTTAGDAAKYLNTPPACCTFPASSTKFVMLFPTCVVSFPKIIKAGAIAATMPPIVTIFFCVSSSRLKNLFARFVTTSTAASIFGARISPIVIDTPSKVDFIIVAFPAKLSIMVVAIFSAAPSLS